MAERRLMAYVLTLRVNRDLERFNQEMRSLLQNYPAAVEDIGVRILGEDRARYSFHSTIMDERVMRAEMSFLVARVLGRFNGDRWWKRCLFFLPDKMAAWRLLVLETRLEFRPIDIIQSDLFCDLT